MLVLLLCREEDPADLWVPEGGHTPMPMSGCEKAALGSQKSSPRVSPSPGSSEAAPYGRPSLTPGLHRAALSSSLVCIKLHQAWLFHPSSVLHGHRLCLFHLGTFQSLDSVSLSSMAQAQRGSFPSNFCYVHAGFTLSYCIILWHYSQKREVVSVLWEILPRILTVKFVTGIQSKDKTYWKKESVRSSLLD